jgi:hypothetical protein
VLAEKEESLAHPMARHDSLAGDRSRTKDGTKLRAAQILLAAALAFDPHVLLLSWSAERVLL